ncbi:MAG: SHOCT domain-containing protein [Solirubrobacteraceae bacterium]
MPLIRTMARTAVIAGTATHVSNNVSRRQSARWQQQAAPPEQPQQQDVQSAAEPDVDPIERLKQLGALHEQGILTDDEFSAQKAKLLGTM